MKIKTSTALYLAMAHAVCAQSISINFGSNETNGSINTGSSVTAGAIPIAGTSWNNMSGATQGTPQSLINSTGAASGASVTWSSANTWRSGSTGGTGSSLNGNLTKGYLDDGGAGNSITVTNVPYLTYNVYVIQGSDQGGATENTNSTYRPIIVNGTYYKGNNPSGTLSNSTTTGNAPWTGSNWTNDDALVEGNHYLKITGQAVATLTVQGGTGTGRGPVAGVQVENSYTGTLSYWDIDGTTPGAGGATPSGNWTDNNWSGAAAGDATTSAWTSGNAAVFAAGTNATGSYTVTVSGTQSADAVWVQEGAVTLTGGALTLGATGLLRADGTASLTVASDLGGTNISTSGNIAVSGNSSYTGSTSVNAGTFTVSNGAAIPDSSAVTVVSGATLALNNNETIGTLSGGGTSALGANSLTVNNTGTNTYSGVFTGSGALNISGSGTQILSGNSTAYTGAITVGSGVTVQVANAAGAFGTSAAGTTVQSGGTIMINSTTGSYNQPGAGEIFTISGTGVGGVGALSSNGGGGGIIKGITLAANASIGGTTRWDIGGGGAGQQAAINGGGFTLTKTGDNNIWMRGTAGGGSITNLAGLVINQGVFGIEFGDNALGTTPVTVNTGGTLSAWTSGPSNLQNTNITLNGGTLDVDAGNITWNGSVNLTSQSYISTDGGNNTISAVISETGGSFGFIKTGGNTLTLTATNTYTGTTTVNAGTLAVSNGSALPDNSPLELSGGGLTLNNSETIGTLSGTGASSLGANTLTINQSADTTYSGAISGSSVINKEGSANLNLTGTSGFTGTTNVNTGTLTLGAGGPAGPLGASTINVASGAILNIAAADGTGYAATAPITITGTMSKATGNFHDTLNRPITLNGGTISATDGNTGSGGAYNLFGNTITTTAGTTSNINITGSTLQLRTNGASTPSFNVVATSTLNVNANIDGFTGTDTAPLTKNGGGTMVLLKNNSYDGATNITAGTLQVGNGGSTGSLGAGAVANDGSLIINRDNAYDVTNAISGTGTLTQAGTGTTTLSGTSTYTGDTTVSAGTLLISGTLGATNTSVGAIGTIGGDGTTGGNLHFDAGAKFIFNTSQTLTVNGSSITFDNFGVDDLLGFDTSVADGTYSLIDGTATVNTANLDNLGLANSYLMGDGRYAYFQIATLELVVTSIPETSTALLGLAGAGLLLRRRRNN